MNGVKRRGTHQLHGLVEGKTAGHIVAQTLQVAEGCMTFVTVIYLLLYTQLLQSKNSANAQQDLLFQTVLPVATIK